MRFETKAIHVGEEPNLREGGSGDVTIPIHLSTTFAREDVTKPTGGYEYSRSSNPTRDALEKRLGALEDAKYGLAFASGMAAESILLFTLLRPGDHVVSSDDLYGGTRRLFNIFNRNFGIEFSYVDLSKPEKLRERIRERTRLIWIETPTNPLMKLCDVEACSRISEDRDITLVVDNTFMSPYFQQPLKLGADIVIHSTTKYLNGHSDSVGGALMLSDPAIYERLKFNQNATGAILSPFDSYMALRGIKTLAVRMKAHERNALEIASFLEAHRRVRKVLYPGLESHPQYELAKRQMYGFGGMISFEIEGGAEEAKEFVEALKVFALAESLGGVESLIELPGLMSHASIEEAERKRIGLDDSLIRMSVGIENISDLMEDLEGAFQAVYG